MNKGNAGQSLIALLTGPIGFGAFWALFTIYGLIALNINNQMLVEYRHAPGCVADATRVDSSLPPCTWITGTITGKDETSGKVGRSWQFCLTGNGQTYNYLDVNSDIYYRNPIGGTIQAKVWRGDVAEVADASGTSGTNKTQAYYRVGDFLFIGLGCFFLFVTAIVILIRMQGDRKSGPQVQASALHEVIDHTPPALGDEAGLNESDMWKQSHRTTTFIESRSIHSRTSTSAAKWRHNNE